MAEANDEQRENELVAYLDGELDERTAHDLEQKLQADAVLRREADGLKRTWELLDFLPQPEPTPTFTSRTLDKLTVLRPTTTSSQAAPVLTSTPLPVAESPTRTALRAGPAPSARTKWVVVAVAAMVLFAVGYLAPSSFSRRGPKPLRPGQAEEMMAKDLRLLDNLSLYQYGDDLAFLFSLDHPDLFGEDSGGH
jgi:anti-sigma factor RsiW